VTRELLKKALLGLYQYASDPRERVDAGLVESFYMPAKDEGSVQTLNQIYTNDAGATPMELHDRYPRLGSSIPIHVIWGDQDSVSPLQGPVGRFYANLAERVDTSVSMSIVRAGHIPFDEVPECNQSMVQWFDTVALSNSSDKQPVLRFPFLR